METKLVCPHCGSDKIDGMAWVKLNSQPIEYHLIDESDEGMYYCSECMRHCIPVEQKFATDAKASVLIGEYTNQLNQTTNMESNQVIIMNDGFMWKPIPTTVARDLLLMGAFEIYVICQADQTESLIDNIQAFEEAVNEKYGVFAIELGNIYNTCLSGVKPMQNVQEITLQAVDSLIAIADCSHEEAQDIALQWGLDFTEKYRDHEFDGETSYYDLIDEYIKYRFEDGGYAVPQMPSRQALTCQQSMFNTTLQYMTLEAYDQISEYFADDPSAAIDLIANWAFEFVGNVNTSPDADWKVSRTDFLERKIKELEDERNECTVRMPDVRFGIGQVVWYISENQLYVTAVKAIYIGSSRTAYELQDGAQLGADSLFKSRAALLASL